MNFVKRLFGNKGDYYKQDEITAKGSLCAACGKDSKLTPTGICGEPCSDELKMAMQKADDEFLFDKKLDYPIKDKIKAIGTNPINKCIFCKNEGSCYFAGDCDKRLPLK